VLFIIDALRYDFIDNSEQNKTPVVSDVVDDHDDHDAEKEVEKDVLLGNAVLPLAKHYTGHFTALHELLQGESSSSSSSPLHWANKLVKCGQGMMASFVADPPTVTAQRLKALTTGGLPTFMEIRQNFNSDAMEEDNWVDQLIAKKQPGHAKKNKQVVDDDEHKDYNMKGQNDDHKVILVGDDTWEHLFPRRFFPSHSMDSFDTRDLHKVDTSIKALLPSLMLKNDWSMIVSVKNVLLILIPKVNMFFV
jgi:predicted AlkP superfamily pyrophosphatase or phosphodiesterase